MLLAPIELPRRNFLWASVLLSHWVYIITLMASLGGSGTEIIGSLTSSPALDSLPHFIIGNLSPLAPGILHKAVFLLFLPLGLPGSKAPILMLVNLFTNYRVIVLSLMDPSLFPEKLRGYSDSSSHGIKHRLNCHAFNLILEV